MSALPRPNYTQIPNVILDHMDKLSDAELRVMLLLCRQTFGWHRERCKASTSFIAKGTGMSEQGVINGVKRMVERGLVERQPDGLSFSYSVVVSDPLNAVEGSKQPLNGVEGSAPKPLNGVEGSPLNGVEANKERAKESSPKKGAGAPAGLEAQEPPAKRRLTDAFVAGWQKRFGGPYKFNGAADGKAADELLKLGLSCDNIMAVAVSAWNNPEGFNSKHAMSLRGLASRFNEIRAEVGAVRGAAKPKQQFVRADRNL